MFPRGKRLLSSKYARSSRRTKSHSYRHFLQSLEPRTLLTTTLTANGSPLTLFLPASGALTATVANFSDSTTSEIASAFSSTITWGDGSSTPGTITGSNGSFAVAGTHTYNDERGEALSISFERTSDNETATTTATATSGDTLTPTFASPAPTATAGRSFNGALATFTLSSNASSITPRNFYALVDWGDATTTFASVSGAGAGAFEVDGSHVYASSGTKAAKIYIIDGLQPGSLPATPTTPFPTGIVSTSGNITVAAGDNLTAAGITDTAQTQGIPFTETLATFTDTNTSSTLNDFVAAIDWNDGTTGTGIITGGSGSFSVSGSHTYLLPGAYSPTITLAAPPPGTATATATSSFTVAENGSLSGSAAAIATPESALFTGTVASFTDTYTGIDPSLFTATITWGDGTTDAGIVSGANGSLFVTGAHTYRPAGNYATSVTLAENSPGTLTKTVAGSAAVTPGPVSASPAFITATEGVSFSGTVASFVNPGGTDPSSEYTATIDWADGSSPAAATVSGSNGNYSISAAHLYTALGSFQPIVTIFEADDLAYQNALTDTAIVADGNVFTGTPIAITPIQGTLFTGPVATFTDTNTTDNGAFFSSTINWGDGTSTVGTLTPTSAGHYSVSGSHTYAANGIYTIQTTLTDTPAGTATSTVNSSTTVADHNIAGTGSPIAAAEGSSFTSVVASFTDTGGTAALGAYSATVNWGDGASSTGAISGSAGNFIVNATHIYDNLGSYTVTTTFIKTGLGQATATSTATIANSDALSATGISFTTPTAQSFTGTIASFADANTGATPAHFTALVNWGDGSSPVAGTVTGSAGHYNILGTHTYASAGAYSVSATLSVISPGTVTATAHATATVSGVPLVGNATAASLTSSLPTATLGQTLTFTATITDVLSGKPTPTGFVTFKDGSATLGTIVLSNAGVATFSSSALAVGAHAITATYAGDANSAPAASSALTQTIVAPNALLINAFYLSLLGRPADSPGIVYWSNLISQGQSNKQIATAITSTKEYFTNLVNTDYLKYLGHAADSASTYWVNKLLAGTLDPTSLAIAIMSSNEAYAHAGNTPAAYITAVYKNFLNRTPASADITYWTTFIAAKGHTAFVTAIAKSKESFTDVVLAAYSAYLRRTPAAGELTYWVNQLTQNTLTPRTLAVTFVTTAEYLQANHITL